ncbi:MAG: adenylyl-sulfate kinase [Eubacteriales bacterium]|nr:adenylyl-sulfate kinase [Eubacteriales bacterium]
MDLFHAAPTSDKMPFRMPVQGVYKFTESCDNRRIIAGTVESGKLNVGDAVVFFPSGKKTMVKSLEIFHAMCSNTAAPSYFSAGEAAGFTMAEQIFVRRGEIACLESEPSPCVGVKLKANLFWLGKSRFVTGKSYYLKCGTAKVEMHLENIERIVNAVDLSCLMRNYVEKNEVAECILTLEAPLAFDLSGSIDQTSRFVIVDDYEIAGGGIITEAMEADDYDTRNIRWSENTVSADERFRCLGQKGIVVWMTGLPGSVKTTIAQEVERRLVTSGYSAYVLDGDKLRRGLNNDLGFSDADRIENMRRVTETANLFRDAGSITLVTLISPFEQNRRKAREIIGNDFLEVYIKASIETCKARDPKKLYQKALSGQIKNFTGIDSSYEIPLNPDLVLDTEKWNEEECAETLYSFILTHLER